MINATKEEYESAIRQLSEQLAKARRVIEFYSDVSLVKTINNVLCEVYAINLEDNRIYEYNLYGTQARQFLGDIAE